MKQRLLYAAAIVAVILAGGLWIIRVRRSASPPIIDHPRRMDDVSLQDVTFYSAALRRDMQYRVLRSKRTSEGPLVTIYLLHGGGATFRDWTNYSDVASFATNGVILVLPEGDDSYYTNAATRPVDRYEDYVIHDLISEIETRFPVARDRRARAIIGISMGGFGAVKIGLQHPELFAFVGGLSPALDVPRRAFSWKRVQQWRYHASIFGPTGSETRRANDPFILVKTANPSVSPYFFLTCGEQEGLLPANREFADALRARGFHFEFHTLPGGHNWDQWDRQMPAIFASAREHLALAR